MSRRLTLLALLLLLTPLLAVYRPQPTAAAGVVSTCTEAALRTALAGGGLVTFSCSGTIPIASEIVITQHTTIDGGGQVTLDGGGVTRLFVVDGDVDLELLGLTLTGGYTADINAGGAVFNGGTLTIAASILTGNRADGLGGAIYNNGALTITDSTLSDNTALGGAWGGAIFNSNIGVVTITGSTLSGNRAGNFGGAIINSDFGVVTITGSTLSGNAALHGGAIISGFSGVVTIMASTLSGNRAGGRGGAIDNSGVLTITASTLSDNSAFSFSGTIHNGGSETLTANILSGSNLCAEFGSTINSGGYNVASDASCGLTATGDLQNVNPVLGNLTTNGGPTETHLPLPGSPAIDHVPNAACVALAAATNGQDQRGAPRPESNGLPCDSGSVEVQINSFFCVGERSGSLRYISVPNGCVRGEVRLLPTAEGIYAFCVGDRSGSMRYLFNSAAGCLRGETKLLLPQVDPITICVGERSRTVRYVVDAGACLRGELAYSIVNPAG